MLKKDESKAQRNASKSFTLTPAISPKRRPKQKAKQESKKTKAKAPPPHSDFAQRKAKAKSECKKAKKAQAKAPPPHTAISPKGRRAKSKPAKKSRPQFQGEKRRSGARRKEAQAVWAKRVPALPTSEASQPVWNCRRRFFFLLPFSFCRQKEKVRASQKKK